MYQYVFQYAGICIQLECPFEIEVSSESEPFIIKEEKNADLRILFRPVEVLPFMSAEGYWNEDMYYTWLDSKPAVYIRNYWNLDPYALFIYESGYMNLFYIEGEEKHFVDTASILNLLGIEKILLDKNALLLHSSFIRYQKKGILFSATSGTGKSTQAELWAKHKGADILNGDRAAVRYDDGQWRAYGMPFAGSSGIYINGSVPLSAIIVLAQGKENRIRRLRPVEAIRAILPECSCRRWDKDFMENMMDLLMQLIQNIPVYYLSCLPDEDAVNVTYEALRKDGYLI